MTINKENIRNDFPILKEISYLDNAATTQKPQIVIDAIKEYYEEENANIHRGVYDLSIKSTHMYELAHAKVAKFIGAKENEIIFTRGTTESINLLSYTIKSIAPNTRSEIVLTQMEHHSNLVPWQEAAKRNGWTLKFIPIKNDFTLDLEAAKELIGERTIIVSANARK